MPYPKSVTIDDQLIPEVEEVEITITRDKSSSDEDDEDDDRPEGSLASAMMSTDDFPGPAEITLKRRARSQPMINFFKHSAKGDSIKGEIVLQSMAGIDTYSIKLLDAFIEKYEFDQPEGDGDLVELITISVSDMQLYTENGMKQFTVKRTGTKSS